MAIKPSPMKMQMAFGEQQRQLKIKYSHYLNKEMNDWIAIFPAYINAKKSISEGRRIQLERAVDNPTCKEIAEVLNANNFNVLLEEKRYYPRELLKDDIHAGRVRVQFYNKDVHTVNLYSEFTTKKYIYLYAADAIKKLKSRQGSSGNKSGLNSTIGNNLNTHTSTSNQQQSYQQQSKSGKNPKKKKK